MIDKAVQIVRREWEKLRQSFEMCGDIGDINLGDPKISKWLVSQAYEGFISNIIEMDRRFPQDGYATLEALNVFTVLGSIAAERLGLNEDMASSFGVSYGFVQTGLFAYHTLEPRQIFFYKIFYPLGVMSCDLDHSLIKTKLKIVFERFRSWQDNPRTYIQDIARIQKMAEAWKEWNEINE
jgi:hypothetical protein